MQNSNVSPVVDASKLGSAQLYNIPRPVNVSNSTYTTAINQNALYSQALVDSQNAQKEADAKLAQSKQSTNDISILQSQLGGKAQDTLNTYNNTGVNQSFNQLQDINAQLTGLRNEASAIPLQVQQNAAGTGATDRGVAPQEAGALRLNAIKSLALGQQAAVAEGNYNKAKNLADQQIAVKYSQIEADLNSKMTQLSSLDKYSLSPAQDKAKQALQMKYQQEQKMIDQQKDDETKVSTMIVNASSQGAPSSLVQKASKAKTPTEAAQILGVYSGDYLSNVLKKSQIAENNAQINKINAEYRKVIQEIKSTSTPLANNAPLGTTASSLSTWTNSAVNKASLVAEERSAISKSFAVVDQIGALQENLKKDQTGFFGGKVKTLMASIGQNADAGTINAQITALVPQVAKGIYGEVGVLTDLDTARYTQTLPNLTSPQKQNDAVTALTLTALRNGVKSRLDVAAASKLDVSGFVPLYQQLTNKINSLNDNTGINDNRVISYGKANPRAQAMIKEMVATGAKSSEILSALGVE